MEPSREDLSVELRPARADTEDGRRFARYLDQAAEGFFGALLGRRKEQILAKAFVEPGHDLSFEHVTFAERDGAVVGMISGYTAEAHKRASDRPLREAAGRWNVRLLTLGILFAPLFRVLETIADGDFYLLAVAVDPEARGSGVGSRLMDHIERQARAAGCARLALHVSGKNEGAQRLYARRGMTVEARWPKRIPLPGLRLLYMVKPL